jgi:hypothetical protein
VDPVPDPLFHRKSGSAGNRTRNLCISSQELWPLDHRGGRIFFIHETKTIGFRCSIDTCVKWEYYTIFIHSGVTACNSQYTATAWPGSLFSSFLPAQASDSELFQWCVPAIVSPILSPQAQCPDVATLCLFRTESQIITHNKHHHHDQPHLCSACQVLWFWIITKICLSHSVTNTVTTCIEFRPVTKTICVRCTKDTWRPHYICSQWRQPVTHNPQNQH